MKYIAGGALFSFSLLAIVNGVDIKNCQQCAYSNIATAANFHGDKDCKENPNAGKFKTQCSGGNSKWKCGHAEFVDGGNFLYERSCRPADACVGSKVNVVVDGKNKEVEWKCCDNEDYCNHGTHVTPSFWYLAALSLVIAGHIHF